MANNNNVTKFRFVRCPKCLELLAELSHVPVYRCGSCGMALKAKQSNAFGDGQNLVVSHNGLLNEGSNSSVEQTVDHSVELDDGANRESLETLTADLLSFNSRNNTITASEPFSIALETIQPAARDSSDDINSDDQQAGDYYNLKGTKKAALPIALFIAATSAALIINAAVPLRFFFLLAPYNTLLYLSLFISAGLAIYPIMNINSTGRNHTSSTTSIISSTDVELVWVLRMLVGLDLITIFLALLLRGLMVQTYSSLKLAWFLFFVVVIVGLIFLYLWMAWKKKNRNNIRTLPSTDPEGSV